jgi:hypothetical protein
MAEDRLRIHATPGTNQKQAGLTAFASLRVLFFSACLGEGFAKPGVSVPPW